MLNFSGRFILPRRGLCVPNFVVREGAESLLKIVFQGDNTDVPAGSNFYIGLAEEVAGGNKLATLATITDELSSAGGYARKPVVRQAADWTITTVNSQKLATSKTVTFAASGANFSAAFSRIFLCNVVSGTSGILYAISGKIDPAVQINDGGSEDIEYEFYI